MSYCVNCGVELDKTAKKCILCGVQVNNPCQPVDETSPLPYPSRVNPLPPFNRLYSSQLLSLLLLLPAVVCLMANLVIKDGGFWAAYPLGALALLWVYFAFPLLWTKPLPILIVVSDTVATLFYIFLIAYTSGDTGWFFRLALPLVLLVGLLVAAIVAASGKRRLKGLYLSIAILGALAVLMVGVEAILDLYLIGAIQLFWSLVPMSACMTLIIVLGIIARSPKMIEELKRRLHI